MAYWQGIHCCHIFDIFYSPDDSTFWEWSIFFVKAMPFYSQWEFHYIRMVRVRVGYKQQSTAPWFLQCLSDCSATAGNRQSDQLYDCFQHFDTNYCVIHTYHAWYAPKDSNVFVNAVKTFSVANVLTNFHAFAGIYGDGWVCYDTGELILIYPEAETCKRNSNRIPYIVNNILIVCQARCLATS